MFLCKVTRWVTNKVGTVEAPGLALAQRQAQGKGLCATVGVPPDSTLTTNTGSSLPEGFFIAGKTPSQRSAAALDKPQARPGLQDLQEESSLGAPGLRTVLGSHSTMKIQS